MSNATIAIPDEGIRKDSPQAVYTDPPKPDFITYEALLKARVMALDPCSGHIVDIPDDLNPCGPQA